VVVVVVVVVVMMMMMMTELFGDFWSKMNTQGKIT
jgi:hypothetical protein